MRIWKRLRQMYQSSADPIVSTCPFVVILQVNVVLEKKRPISIYLCDAPDAPFQLLFHKIEVLLI